MGVALQFQGSAEANNPVPWRNMFRNMTRGLSVRRILWYGTVAGCCEHRYESSGSV